MRPIAVALICLSLASAPAFAEVSADAQSLDLSLPAGSTYRNDPPGTFYGDSSGVPAAEQAAAAGAPVRWSACPTAPDGEERAITGSVSTGVGYSSRLGNSHYNAASVNYCKSYTNDDGDERTINVQMNMGTYDGPGDMRYAPYGGMRGPRGPR